MTRSGTTPDSDENAAPLHRRIRDEAQRLGFEQIGFAPASDPGEEDHLRAWLAAGYQGEMSYMERVVERRADATREHDWARTMICLSRSYAQPAPAHGPLHGRVAVYALGDDYHDWLRRDLKALARFLRDECGVRTRIAVDTAPILERPYAREAGLGWIGKNTLLLSRETGSLTFLAEILTDLDLGDDLDLAPPAQATNHCGTCRRCLDACPTDAFPQPYVLDSRRCISYLTIEYRGVIDRDLRPLMGNWIFGCDICQDVCPWNKFARPTTAADAAAAADLAPADLAAFLDLDDAAFRARFRRSPIFRAGRDGFLRNVAIALGNSRSEEAVAPLAKAVVGDPSRLVRQHCAWALGAVSAHTPSVEEAHAALATAAARETDFDVAEEIAAALAAIAGRGGDGLHGNM